MNKILLFAVLLSFIFSSYAQKIDAGDRHSIYLCPDGTVKGWWSNTDKQVSGYAENYVLPQTIDGIDSVIDISGGTYHTLFLRHDGTVWGIGRNTAGQLGGLGEDYIHVPTQIPNLSDVIAIAAGG